MQDLYSIDIGALTPPSLLDICADYVRTNLDTVLEMTTFKGVPQDIIDHVVFKRDLEGRLRGKCKLCRPGRCCVYRMQKMEPCPQDKQDPARANVFGCVCGHSTFHHEVVEESSTLLAGFIPRCWRGKLLTNIFVCCPYRTLRKEAHWIDIYKGKSALCFLFKVPTS